MNEEAIKGFLNESAGIDTTNIESDTLLFSTGVIDSFSLVSLLTLVESQCGFRIDPMDVNLDNFDSIGRIMSYVERRQADA